MTEAAEKSQKFAKDVQCRLQKIHHVKSVENAIFDIREKVKMET